MIQSLLVYFFFAGIVLTILGILWLYLVAFAQERRWFYRMLIFPPLSLGFIARAPQLAWKPSATIALGLFLAIAPAIYTRTAKIDLSQHERLVDGQVQVTLTGWDQHDYSFLPSRQEIAVLQMANADVDDKVLTYVGEMKNLVELDISHSAVTDAGLAALAKLPHLEKLRLVKTAVTDAGVSAHLTPHPTLKMLDVGETAVTKGALTTFKQQFQGRRTTGGKANPQPPVVEKPLEQEAVPAEKPPAEPNKTLPPDSASKIE